MFLSYCVTFVIKMTMFISYNFSLKDRWFVSLFNKIEVMNSKIVSPAFTYKFEYIEITIII